MPHPTTVPTFHFMGSTSKKGSASKNRPIDIYGTLPHKKKQAKTSSSSSSSSPLVSPSTEQQSPFKTGELSRSSIRRMEGFSRLLEFTRQQVSLDSDSDNEDISSSALGELDVSQSLPVLSKFMLDDIAEDKELDVGNSNWSAGMNDHLSDTRKELECHQSGYSELMKEVTKVQVNGLENQNGDLHTKSTEIEQENFEVGSLMQGVEKEMQANSGNVAEMEGEEPTQDIPDVTSNTEITNGASVPDRTDIKEKDSRNKEFELVHSTEEEVILIGKETIAFTTASDSYRHASILNGEESPQDTGNLLTESMDVENELVTEESSFKKVSDVDTSNGQVEGGNYEVGEDDNQDERTYFKDEEPPQDTGNLPTESMNVENEIVTEKNSSQKVTSDDQVEGDNYEVDDDDQYERTEVYKEQENVSNIAHELAIGTDPRGALGLFARWSRTLQLRVGSILPSTNTVIVIGVAMIVGVVYYFR